MKDDAEVNLALSGQTDRVGRKMELNAEEKKEEAGNLLFNIGLCLKYFYQGGGR